MTKTGYRIIDTHAHLEEISDLDKSVAEAKAAGIYAVISVGSDYTSNEKTLELSERYKGFVYPALGLHPYNLKISEIEQTLEFIAANISRAVAVGEIGLDYHKRVRANADKELQQRVFRQLLEIARAHDKPALVHSRYAWKDALDLVHQSRVRKAVFHWYTGTSSVLREIVDLGYFISATPAVEYHEEHRRAVKEIPLERLLLETDSPVTYGRGREFEYEARPVCLLRTLAGTARLREMAEKQIADITTANAIKFFGLRANGNG